jgi:hypothetical protein
MDRALVIETGHLRNHPPADHRRVLDVIFWVTRPAHHRTICLMRWATGTLFIANTNAGRQPGYRIRCFEVSPKAAVATRCR